MSNLNKLNSWPIFDEKQIEIAVSVLKSGKVNSWTGEQTKLFEKEFALYHNSSYAIALANGTLALQSAYSSLDLSEGDEFITTPRTFIATSSAGVLLGAKPIFADVDFNSGLITAKTIEPLITKKTKAISVVHLAGWPADMEQICSLADSHNIPVVEDCSQAHGAYIVIKGERKYVGTFGDVSTWSFCQDKIMSTAGEGGMVLTNKKLIWNHVWSLKDHGKCLGAVNNKNNVEGFKWLHENFGNNFRLTELQSAIGRFQLKELSKWISLRTRNAEILKEYLSDIPLLRIPLPPDNIKHAWYKFYVYIDNSYLASGWSRNRILAEISTAGYPGLSGSCSEIYKEKCFLNKGINPENELPIAKVLGDTSLMFLVHPTINEKQMHSYAESIRNITLRATK